MTRELAPAEPRELPPGAQVRWVWVDMVTRKLVPKGTPGARRALAYERFVDRARATRRAHISRTVLRHPLDGDVYWLDPELEPSDQAIVLLADVPVELRSERWVWYVNGAEVGEWSPTARVDWTPTPGRHVIGLGRGREESRVDIEVVGTRPLDNR